MVLDESVPQACRNNKKTLWDQYNEGDDDQDEDGEGNDRDIKTKVRCRRISTFSLTQDSCGLWIHKDLRKNHEDMVVVISRIVVLLNRLFKEQISLQ